MTASIGYQNRRYLVVDGKVKKSWVNPPEPGWFVEKADAWADHAEKIARAKAFDEALAAKKALRAAQTPPEIAPDPAASETPPPNGRDQDTEVEGPETPEPESTEETPELELATSPPAPQPAPEATPPAPQQVIRMPELMRRVNQSRTAIDRGIKAGTFPAPDLDLGDGQRGWFRATIEAINPAEPEPEVA